MEFCEPKLVISPMAGVTDAPFRDIARQCGADYGISEMITSQTKLWGNRKTRFRLRSHFVEKPKIIQISGASPEYVYEAAASCLGLGVDAIELNMGCPAKKVCNVLAGSALLKDEALVAKILRAAVDAVDIPIYLKTRLGWDHNNKNILTIATMAQEIGVKSLAIHGRTRSDFYTGEADFALISKVKQQLHIPVFANGDIISPEKALQVMEQTNANGLYIGRGALGKPWLFQQIKDYFVTGSYSAPDKDFIINLMLQHIDLIHQHYGEVLGVRYARKHFKWYLQANSYILGDVTALFDRFAKIEDIDEQLEFINNL